MAKILVVDDSRLTRRVIVGALTQAGHEIVQAGNGVDALKAYHAFSPDCVMSDLLMPEMDGFELTEALRALDPALPIVVSTADIQDKSRLRCEEIGVTRMLTKPLKAAEILETVDAVLADREATVQ